MWFSHVLADVPLFHSMKLQLQYISTVKTRLKPRNPPYYVWYCIIQSDVTLAYGLVENAFTMTNKVFRENSFEFQRHLKCFLYEASSMCFFFFEKHQVFFHNLVRFLLKISSKNIFPKIAFRHFKSTSELLTSCKLLWFGWVKGWNYWAIRATPELVSTSNPTNFTLRKQTRLRETKHPNNMAKKPSKFIKHHDIAKLRKVNDFDTKY